MADSKWHWVVSKSAVPRTRVVATGEVAVVAAVARGCSCWARAMSKDPSPQYVSKYRSKVQWDKHFGAKQRIAFAAKERLGRGSGPATRCVTFQRVLDLSLIHI